MPRARRRKRRVVRAKTARRRRIGGVGGVRAGGRGPLASAVASLRRARVALTAQRDDLDRRIAALDNALSAMGAAVRPVAGARVAVGRGRGGRGGRRAGSLKDYIARVLSAGSGAMAVKDIAAAVVKAGYKSSNKTLAKSVGSALAHMPDVLKVGRGLFKMK